MSIEEYELQFITFKLHDIEYGVDLYTVVQTFPVSTITKLANMPPHILGIFNFRNEQIPVFDILKFEDNNLEGAIGDLGVFIVVEIASIRFALYADCILDVLSIKSSGLKSNPIGKVSRFVKGFVRHANKNVSILNLDQIMLLSGLRQ